VTEGNVWTKLHRGLEFVQDVHYVLNLRRGCQHLVARMLTPDQKEIQKTISGDVFDMAFKEKFLKNIITGVTWCFL
jgi:hypothetical protein